MFMKHVAIVLACINMYGSQNRRNVAALLLAVAYLPLSPILSLL